METNREGEGTLRVTPGRRFKELSPPSTPSKKKKKGHKLNVFEGGEKKKCPGRE